MPTVFFGLYDLRDYIALARHRGKAWVLWAGSDLRNLASGFAFNDGKLKWLSKLTPHLFDKWIRGVLCGAEHYVENEREKRTLASYGIGGAHIVPSFLGDIKDYPITYKWRERPQVFMSVHQGREIEYGITTFIDLAKAVPECDFHVYGTTLPGIKPNIFCHGTVSKEQFNREIRDFHCGLRPNESDGASEIMVKSILNGGYPITRIFYPNISQYETFAELVAFVKGLKDKKEPNTVVRESWLALLNAYPWNKYV